MRPDSVSRVMLVSLDDCNCLFPGRLVSSAVPDRRSLLCSSKFALLSCLLDFDECCGSFRSCLSGCSSMDSSTCLSGWLSGWLSGCLPMGLLECLSSGTDLRFCPLGGGGPVRFWEAAEGSEGFSGGLELIADVLGERTAFDRVFFREGAGFLFFCTPLELFPTILLRGMLNGREDNETINHGAGQLAVVSNCIGRRKRILRCEKVQWTRLLMVWRVVSQGFQHSFV